MDARDVLIESFDRIEASARDVLADLDPDLLTARLDPDANTIAWLVWHLSRVADDHVAEVAGTSQVWEEGWSDRFDLPFDPAAHGYGQTSEDVAAVTVGGDLLWGYHQAVHHRVHAYLGGLEAHELTRVVDEQWDPPVTLGVRLVSLINDGTQHVGQAAFLRGVLERQASRG